MNRIIFGAGLALLGIGVGYRALFGAVTFPTAGAGCAFRTDVAAFFTGCFIGEVIADGAPLVFIAMNRRGNCFANSSGGARTGIPAGNRVASVIAAVTFQSVDVFHILISVVAVSGLALFGEGMRGRTNGVVIIVIVVVKQ